MIIFRISYILYTSTMYMQKNICNPQIVNDQVNRMQGQVTGIGRMIDDGRSCAEILQQVVAARASLQKLGIMLLEAEAKGCLDKEVSPAKLKDLEQVISQLFKIT